MLDWLTPNISPPRLGVLLQIATACRRRGPCGGQHSCSVVYKINEPPLMGAASEIINQRRSCYYNTSFGGTKRKEFTTTQLHKVQQVNNNIRHRGGTYLILLIYGLSTLKCIITINTKTIS